MPTVETTISVSIPEGVDLGELEGLVWQAMPKGGQELLLLACQQGEEQVLTGRGRTLRREKQRFLEQLTPGAKMVAVVGSGAVEKEQDLVVGRRFKGQGMRWTRKGANRLLKLRLRELERAA